MSKICRIIFLVILSLLITHEYLHAQCDLSCVSDASIFEEDAHKTSGQAYEIVQRILTNNESCDSCKYIVYGMLEWVEYLGRQEGNYNIANEAINDLHNLVPTINYKDSLTAWNATLDTKLRRAHFYRDINAINQAKDLYSSILDDIGEPNFDDNESYLTHIYCMQNLGLIYFRQGQYYKSIEYYQYCINLQIKKSELYDTPLNIATENFQIAQSYKALKKHDEARYYFTQCNDHTFNFINTTIEERKQRFSQYFLTYIIEELAFSIDQNDTERIQALINHGDQLIFPGKIKNAEYYLKKYEYYSKTNQVDSFTLYESKIERILREDNIELYNNYQFTKAKINLFKQNFENTFAQIDAAFLAYEKTDVETRYEITEKLDLFKLVFNSIKESGQSKKINIYVPLLLDHIQESLGLNSTFNDHIYHLESYIPLLDKSLEFLIAAEPINYNLVYEIIESVKSIKLTNQFKNSQFRIQKNDSLIIKYNLLKSEFIQNILSKEKNESIEKEQQLFIQSKKLDDLAVLINSRDSDSAHPSLLGYQKRLQKGQMHQLYFIGADQYYVLNIGKKLLGIETINRHELNQLIARYTVLTNEPNKYNELKFLLNKIYELLFPNGLETFDQIIISPDGDLQKLAFESLLNDEHRFLIEDYNIYYTPSCTFNFSDTDTKATKAVRSVIYASSKNSPISLPFAEKEIEVLHKSLDSDVYSKDNINKNILLNSIEQYDLVHISTHGTADIADFHQSYLNFGNDERDNKLYFDEIGTLTLNTKLVNISACQTGKGKVFEGEGTMGLSRNFLAAGAHSVISSLWSISDQSSLKINTNFVEELIQGKSVSNALSEAKRIYLSEHIGVEKHPYYWAGMVHQGKDLTIYINPNRKYLFILPILLLVSLIWILRVQRSNT